MQVATSDGVLRFYTFGRMDSSAGGPSACVVAPPQPLPPPPQRRRRVRLRRAGAEARGAEAQAAEALPEEREFEVSWVVVGIMQAGRDCARNSAAASRSMASGMVSTH